jgi:hypothetical protein
MLELGPPDNGMESEGSRMPSTQLQRSPLNPCLSLMPTIRDVVDVFEGLESGLGFVEFQYVPQRKPKKICPSLLEARADTKYSRAGQADPSLVQAYVPHGGEYEGDRANAHYWIQENDNRETRVLLRNLHRQSKGEGYHKDEEGNPLEAGRFLWRAYLLSGIKLDTVQAVVNGEKTRLFPNAPAGFRNGF